MRLSRSAIACAIGLCIPVSAVAQDSYVETQAAPVRDTNSQARVDAAELETTSPRAADDLLAAVPGLYVVQHGNEGKGLQFYLRGFDAVHGSDFAVSVEGIPLNEFSNVHGHGYVDLGFIVPEAVSHLDVTRGAYTMPQGNFATAGAVDLGLGAAPWDYGASLTYEIGTTNRHRLVALDAGPHRLLGAEVLYDQGFGEGRGSMRAGVTSRQRLLSKPHSKLDALVIAGASRFELPGALRLEDIEAEKVGFYDSYEVGDGDTSRGLVGLHSHGKRSWGTYKTIGYLIGRSLDLEENFTGSLRNPERGDRRHQREASLVVGAQSAWRFAWRRSHIDTLLSTRHNRVRQSEDQVLSSGEAWLRSRELQGAMTQVASALGWGTQGDVFGVELGLRSELFIYDEIAAESVVALPVSAPRASVRALLGDFTVFTAAGLGYRAPELRSVFAEEPPVDRAPEDAEIFDGGNASVSRAYNAEVGARFYRPRFEVGLTGFGVFVAREVVFDHVSGINLELSSTRRFGGELDVEVRPFSLLQIAADLTLVDGRFIESGDAIPGSPHVLGTVRLFAGKPSAFRAGLSTTYLGVRPLPHGARAADSVLVGLTASAELGAFEIGADVDNALGGKFRDGEYHFASSWGTGPRSTLPAVHVVAGPPLSARVHLTYRFRSEEAP